MSQTNLPTRTKEQLKRELDFSPDAVAYRKLVRSIEKPLLERYLKECSKAHKTEFKKLVAKGMALGEAKHVHSDYPDWALGEVIHAFWDLVD